MTEKKSKLSRHIASKNGILSAFTAVLLVLSVPLLIYLVGTGTITITGGVLFGLFSLLTTMAGVRLFGKDTLQAVREARGKE